MTWHIIGSKGYIANCLLKSISTTTPIIRYAHHPIESERSLELTEVNEEQFSDIRKGDFVVMLAAISSPDICDKQFHMAYATNVTGTEALIRICLDRGAYVLFFSSDVVVGATDNAYDETMPVSPVGSYAIMKRHVEEAFIGEPGFKVFRLSYVFSRNDKFMRYLQICVQDGKVADVFQALYRNVIWLGDVVQAIVNLSQNFNRWDNSVFHLSGPELLCRADMAEQYRRMVAPGLLYSVSIPDENFFAVRPNRIETRSVYLSKLLGREPVSLARAMELEFNEIKRC